MDYLHELDSWAAFACFVFVLASYILKFGKILYVYFIAKYFLAKKDFQKSYGEWAVITGGSDGIGKNYAIQLAKRKINLVLISNVEKDLISVSKDIEKNFGVQTKIIVADFSQSEDEYQRIFSQLKDLKIDILVNNVGISTGLPSPLEELTRKQIWDLIMVNACSAVSMTHYLLPQMKSNGRGLIINMSSASQLLPTPYATLYGASKVFLRSFSEALRFECSGSGVEVQTLCPYYVNTKICENSNAVRHGRFLVPSPEKFAESAVATVGFSKFGTGYWPHELQYMLIQAMPQWLNMKICVFLMRYQTPKIPQDVF